MSAEDDRYSGRLLGYTHADESRSYQEYVVLVVRVHGFGMRKSSDSRLYRKR